MKAYLALGANLGDRKASLDRAVELINASECVSVTKTSSYIETAPVGYADQPDFLNAVIEIETALSPRELLKKTLSIEEEMGRTRTIRWGPRVIDIDILMYEHEIVDEDDLQLPHPRMMERGFVLRPPAEIAPDLILPDGRTSSEAVKALSIYHSESSEESRK